MISNRLPEEPEVDRTVVVTMRCWADANNVGRLEIQRADGQVQSFKFVSAMQMYALGDEMRKVATAMTRHHDTRHQLARQA